MSDDVSKIVLRSAGKSRLRQVVSKFVKLLRGRKCGGRRAQVATSQTSTQSIDWKVRAHSLGAYSVIDTRHSRDSYEEVTAKHKAILFPVLARHLGGICDGDALDFGCGAGRFTADLASFVNGVSCGFDPTEELIALSESNDSRVMFTHSEEDVFSDFSVERYSLIWVCHVLGGLSDDQIRRAADRFYRVLRQDGVLFIIESTSQVSARGHWQVRTVDHIRSLFPQFKMDVVDSYVDIDLHNSIILGKRADYSKKALS